MASDGGIYHPILPQGKLYLRRSSIQTRSWVDKDGQKRHTVEIVADEAYFVDARAESTQTGARVTSGEAATPQTATATYIPESYTQVPSFGELEDGEELPF